MADDKEQIKKEMAFILKLDAQIDYSQRETAAKYHKEIEGKGLLTTPIGRRYVKKLEQIASGDTSYDKCLFCNSQTQKDTVICPSCMARLKKPAMIYCRNCGGRMPASSESCPACGSPRGEGYKYCAHCGREVPMPDMEALAGKVKDKSKALAEQAVRLTRENVQDLSEKGARLAGNLVADAKAKKDPAGAKGGSKKRMILRILGILLALSVLGAIGWNRIFMALAFIALAAAIYMAVKKKPKKYIAIAFAAFLLLSCTAGLLDGNAATDNILDYLGTEESVVYKTYDKETFETLLPFSDTLVNRAAGANAGVPTIYLDSGSPRRVKEIIITKETDPSFHINGLHINDSMEQAEKCMKELNAVYNEAESRKRTAEISSLVGSGTVKTMVYDLNDHGRALSVAIDVEDGSIAAMTVCYPDE